MINTLLYRILLAIPTMLGVAVICFMLVQIAPGDPLVSVMPPDASEALRQTLMQLTALISRCPCSLSTGCGGRCTATLVCRSPRPPGDRRSDDRGGLLSAPGAAGDGDRFVLGSLFGLSLAIFATASLTVWPRYCRCLASACRTTGWGCCW